MEEWIRTAAAETDQQIGFEPLDFLLQQLGSLSRHVHHHPGEHAGAPRTERPGDLFEDRKLGHTAGGDHQPAVKSRRSISSFKVAIFPGP